MHCDEAIILAGGLGTRLQPVLKDRPKPMAPIGGQPFLAYLLRYLSAFNIRHIVLSVGFRHSLIKSHFGNAHYGIDLTYAIEDEPLGTGGAIRYALNYIQGDLVFILNGDTFFNVNLKDLETFYYRHDADLVMAVRQMHGIRRYGIVKMKGSAVTGFSAAEKATMGYINGGIYIMKPSLLGRFELPGSFSFESGFLERTIKELRIYALKCSDYFIDIGIPEDYEKARRELPYLFP
ncbi:MAG: nucleotidyltransferase family protein [Bacteroidales bacterium]|nr:nucleotidyltransferase family protein [Bacteroidales bacterium]MBN2697740.1 nucleotidyltransferase family protein [Bacteroidales bacterium]